MDKVLMGKHNGGMKRFGTKDRILYMHSAHPSVGVSRFAQFAESESVRSTLAVDVFSPCGDRASMHRLIARLLAFDPDANWLLQSHVDRAEMPSTGECDCLVILAGEEPFSPAFLDGFRAHAEKGGAMVALRIGAGVSFAWKEFSKEILGADLQLAASAAKTTPQIAAGRYFHPVLHDVSSWVARDAVFPVLDSRAAVFMEASDGMQKHPLAWGFDNGRQRIFSTALGSPTDFSEASFHRLIWNAVSWTMEKRADIR
jgi:hypothetical protein